METKTVQTVEEASEHFARGEPCAVRVDDPESPGSYRLISFFSNTYSEQDHWSEEKFLAHARSVVEGPSRVAQLERDVITIDIETDAQMDVAAYKANMEALARRLRERPDIALFDASGERVYP